LRTTTVILPDTNAIRLKAVLIILPMGIGNPNRDRYADASSRNVIRLKNNTGISGIEFLPCIRVSFLAAF
jgi:hypothetical protein